MEQLVREIVGRVVAGRGFELVDVEIHSNGRRPLIRVFIEKTGGITVGDCSLVTREINVNFLVEESIPEDSLLEVSSPGLDRPFKTLRDYERNLGKQVEVRYADKGRELTAAGRLESASAEGVTLNTPKGALEIRMESVKTAKQHISF